MAQSLSRVLRTSRGNVMQEELIARTFASSNAAMLNMARYLFDDAGYDVEKSEPYNALRTPWQ